MISDSDRKYLSTAAEETGRYRYSTEHRKIIDRLHAAGILRPAPFEVIFEPAPQLSYLTVGSRQLPICGRLVSLYTLTEAGRRAMERPQWANDVQ
jgi:hypothetical protein